MHTHISEKINCILLIIKQHFNKEWVTLQKRKHVQKLSGKSFNNGVMNGDSITKERNGRL